jgi:hypothetical protein
MIAKVKLNGLISYFCSVDHMTSAISANAIALGLEECRWPPVTGGLGSRRADSHGNAAIFGPPRCSQGVSITRRCRSGTYRSHAGGDRYRPGLIRTTECYPVALPDCSRRTIGEEQDDSAARALRC